MPLNPIKYTNPTHPAEARRKADANKVPWVPVLASTGQPLMPCHPARARELVRKGLATKSYLKGVFHIKLTQRTKGDTQVVALGVDPGSKMNGYSLKSPDHTYLNIQQPAKDGSKVKDAVAARASMRRGRRNRHTPCRPPRFDNRTKKDRVPPSTLSRWQHIYNTIAMLCRLYPIQHCIVEDVKATTKQGKKRWNQSFSPVMAGKNWLYRHIRLLGLELHLAEGYTTAELRLAVGLPKDHRKLDYNFFTHAVDAWVLANGVTGGHMYPDMIQLTRLHRPRYVLRQLHIMQPKVGGVRPRRGGTALPGGIRKGIMVKYNHPKTKGSSHLALVTGYSAVKGYSLSFIDDVGRYTQNAQLDRMQLLYRTSWLWQFPWSYKGYSSRRAHRRDITNAPTKVVNHYQ